MKTRRISRSLTVAMLSAGLVVAVDGCSATRKMSSAKPSGADEAPVKQYQWSDMSTGKSFFGGPKTSPGASPPQMPANTSGN